MANTYSRRTLLKGVSLAGLGAVAACDVVAFPGASQGTSQGTGTATQPGTVPPPPGAPSGTNVPPAPSASANASQGFAYEIQYSDAEWRERLTPAEYQVLRKGGTEPRNSHRYTQTSAEGTYHCKGCALPIYPSTHKINLDIGWVFFHHAMPDSVLTGIDKDQIEAHCRRCGSHLGHILAVEGEVLHCINGTALEFIPA